MKQSFRFIIHELLDKYTYELQAADDFNEHRQVESKIEVLNEVLKLQENQ